MTWPGAGFYVNYDYAAGGEVTKIRLNGATTGTDVLATYGYDALDRRHTLTYGNGSASTYDYDKLSRLTSLAITPASLSPKAVTKTLQYNGAGAITTHSSTNTAYDYAGPAAAAGSYTVDGLNQMLTAPAASPAPGYDTRGNLTSDGSGRSYGYDALNRLTSATVNATTISFAYDPLNRLLQIYNGATTPITRTRFSYDNAGEIVTEFDGSNGNAVERRYVKGPGTDETVVWFEGAGTGDRRYLQADERGSVAAVSTGASANASLNTYDEYGRPALSNTGRMQYTGQAALTEFNPAGATAAAGLYYYKARFYDATRGRFLQTDPLGYAAGPNLYTYAGGNPVNLRDPSGLWDLWCTIRGKGCETVTVTATHISWFDLHQILLANDRPRSFHWESQTGTNIKKKVYDDGSQPDIPCDAEPTSATQREAVADALSEVGVENASVSSLSEDFAQIDPSTRFYSNVDWTPAYSAHSSAAFEHAISGDFYLKVYFNDQDFGGKTVAAITDQTLSISHISEYIGLYLPFGVTLNGERAADYLYAIGDCF